MPLDFGTNMLYGTKIYVKLLQFLGKVFSLLAYIKMLFPITYIYSRYFNVFADWMTVAMIALSRFMILKKTSWFEGAAKYILIFIWVYAGILLYNSIVRKQNKI